MKRPGATAFSASPWRPTGPCSPASSAALPPSRSRVLKIVFITNGATSEFLTADLLEAGKGNDSYALTHDGKTVTFTAGEEDVSGILVKA